MIGVLEQLDLRDPDAVIRALDRGAAANRDAACRRGSIDMVGVTAERSTPFVLTGDLHDNVLHLARLMEAAGLGGVEGTGEPAHLTLHELIHSDRLVNGMDFSFRMLARVAALKAAAPERVHALLANHELAQLNGSEVVKEGVRMVAAFNEAVEFSFGDEAPRVEAAVKGFLRSMPLALRIEGDDGQAMLCAHSLPAPELMPRFDPAVLERPLVDEDYVPRMGSAHLMVWGRGHQASQIGHLGRRWGVSMFVLGHEHAESGAMVLAEGSGGEAARAIVLNSDHARGVYWHTSLRSGVPWPGVREAMGVMTPLSPVT